MYDNPTLCTECGGKCCKKIPGPAHPSDFGCPKRGWKKNLETALQSGKWAIDWWEGDPRPGGSELYRVYYVRPATKGNEGIRFDASWGGECTFLGDTGCTLSSEGRPTVCRLVEPKAKGNCKYHGKYKHDKRDSAIKWIPHQKLLSKGDIP